MEERDSSSPEQKHSLLIADDDVMFRTVAAELARSWGYECTTVADGEAALAVLTQDRSPTIAILDWLMPKLTGPEICRRMRASGSPQYIYFILVSARDGREDSIEGLRSGADTYISKPLDAEELRAKLEIASRILDMEGSLRDLHAETELFINSVPSILIGTDREGRITRWNLGAERIFGLSKEDVIRDRTDNEFKNWWKTGAQRHVEEVVRTGLSSQLNVAFNRNDTQRLIGLTIHPLKSHTGATIGSVIIGSDVTDKSLREDQLRQAQKLEAIGQLAAGIAHEINTPTQFVNDNVTFFKESWGSVAELLAAAHSLVSAAMGTPETVQNFRTFQEIAQKLDLEYLLREVPLGLDQTLDGLQRIKNIVRAMKEFSHPSSNEKRPTDINAAIQTTLTVSRSEWKYVADLNIDLDPNLPHVPCVADQFNQAILNIIVNAAHAIAERVQKEPGSKGRITIRTRQNGDWAEIDISDTGGGIPKEIRDRVFEPFFSTKEVGKGTGQGLTLAHTIIVKKHAGKIWFDSDPGRGTTFFIRLPLSFEKASKAAKI